MYSVCRVTSGITELPQTLAKVEDREIAEQVKQAQASFDVAAATIRQREADLRLAQTNLERSKNLFERSLIPKQTFDDTDARYQAAAAQLDLAKAQYQQAQARLDELKINLANTIIASPVSGFVGKRALDPGAWVTPNSSFISKLARRCRSSGPSETRGSGRSGFAGLHTHGPLGGA